MIETPYTIEKDIEEKELMIKILTIIENDLISEEIKFLKTQVTHLRTKL